MSHVATKQALAASVLVVSSLFLSNAAFAVASTTYSFVGVTNTRSANTALGVGSLSVEVIKLLEKSAQ